MRIAVTGDDIAGLTLALRLRIKGHDVTVHDLDAPSLVDMPSPIDDVFTVIAPYRDLFLKSGIALDEVIGIAPVLTPFTVGRVTLPSSGAQAPAIGAALGDDAAREWSAFLEGAADTWSRIRLDRFVARRPLPEELRRSLRTSELRDVASAFAPEPLVLSDAGVVFPYLVQTFGRWRFEGGVSRFTEVLRVRCNELGVMHSATPAPADAVSLDHHFTGAFGAPKRWFKRAREITTQQLGIPFIGMAAEAVADRIGRA